MAFWWVRLDREPSKIHQKAPHPGTPSKRPPKMHSHERKNDPHPDQLRGSAAKAAKAAAPDLAHGKKTELSPSEVIALQRSVGNAEVTRMLRRAPHAPGPGCGHPGTTQSPTVQRALTHQGAQLNFDDARARVLDVQSAELTVDEKQELERLVNGEESHEIKDSQGLVRLLRARLRTKWGLEDKEVDRFDEYQGGAYKKWNETLRGDSKAKKRAIGEETTDMIAGLAKTAKTKQKVYRTLSFGAYKEFADYIRQFEVGKEYTASQFESTTRGTGNLDLPGQSVYVVTLHIEATGHHGGELSSAIHTIQKSEGETVFPPGTKFKVDKGPDKPEADQDYSSTHQFKTTIELEELAELDMSKQRIPTRAEVTADMFSAGSGSRPGGADRPARKGSF